MKVVVTATGNGGQILAQLDTPLYIRVALEARAGNAEAAGVASRAKKGQESMENELARTGG
jgi:hypothetical protein